MNMLPLAQLQDILPDWNAVWSYAVSGGITMVFLALLSIVGLAFALERLLRLRRSRIAPRGFADRVIGLWNRDEHEQVTQLCQQDDSILAHAVQAMVEYRDTTTEGVKTIAGDLAAVELRPHYRRLQPLNVVAVLAPLLGLFGTVAGMISAFAQFQLLGQTGDPGVFAGSISKALITTATGLMIAMPALAVFHYFKNLTNAHADRLEEQLQQIVLRCFVKPRVGETSERGDVIVTEHPRHSAMLPATAPPVTTP